MPLPYYVSPEQIMKDKAEYARKGISRDDAVNLACRGLWEAADADSATGGPDALRGIYPVVATIDELGWERLSDSDLADRYTTIATEVRSR